MQLVLEEVAVFVLDSYKNYSMWLKLRRWFNNILKKTNLVRRFEKRGKISVENVQKRDFKNLTQKLKKKKILKCKIRMLS